MLRKNRKGLIRLRGFTLADVLIAVTLTSFLVILLTGYVRDAMAYSSFVSKHQQVRSEAFALVNNTLASLIREAVAIDYERTTETELALFMDKNEEQSMLISLDQNMSEKDGVKQDESQLVLNTGDEMIYLNSTQTFVDDFQVTTTADPTDLDASQLQEARAKQPMVKVTVKARHQRLDGARDRSDFSFWEDPWISYTGAYTLRNYSLSSLR
ncbi:MAG: hypothetical protein Q8O95_06060 [bacterium]|nr:hypothetical protein [bacterium]